MSEDENHLEILATFHYVLGAIVGLFACLPLIHAAFGLLFMGVGMAAGELAPSLFGLFFLALAGGFVLLGWTLALALIVAGRKIKRRESWNYCLFVAAAACLFMPLGTILGVFTIIVLMRPSVKSLFGMHS